jgi:hypothetical protein
MDFILNVGQMMGLTNQIHGIMKNLKIGMVSL